MTTTAEDASLNVALSGRMKHGDLLRAMRERGWNQRQLGEFLGLDNSRVGALLNLKWVPKRISKAFEEKLVSLTGKLPEDLWPEWTHSAEFTSADKRVDLYRDVTPAMLAGSGAVPQLPPAPDEVFSEDERRAAIDRALKTLTPREEKVIRALHFDDGSVDSVAKEYCVSRGRVYQIEQRALAKLALKSRGLREYA